MIHKVFEPGKEPICKTCLQQTKGPYKVMCNRLGFVTKMKKCDMLKSTIQHRVKQKEFKEKFKCELFE